MHQCSLCSHHVFYYYLSFHWSFTDYSVKKIIFGCVCEANKPTNHTFTLGYWQGKHTSQQNQRDKTNMTMNLEVLRPCKCPSQYLYTARLIHGSKCSLWSQSSACEEAEKQDRKEKKSIVIIILSPFVLQKKTTTQFLSSVDWNRVDMHTVCVSACWEEKLVSNA